MLNSGPKQVHISVNHAGLFATKKVTLYCTNIALTDSFKVARYLTYEEQVITRTFCELLWEKHMIVQVACSLGQGLSTELFQSPIYG